MSTIEKKGLIANKSSFPLGFEAQKHKQQAELRAASSTK